MTKILTLTDKEFEAVRWAVGNFISGDADDCGGSRSRSIAMQNGWEKLVHAAAVVIVTKQEQGR